MQENDTDEKDVKRMRNTLIKIILVLIFIIVEIASLVFTVKNRISNPDCSPEEAWQKMSDADVIVLEGRKSWVFAKPLIEADGEMVGRLQEKGFFNPRYQIKSGKTILKYYEYGAPELSEEPLGNSYTFYDGEGNITGYVQETLTEMSDGTSEYIYLYYDSDGIQKPYYLDETDGWRICNMDGEVQAEAVFEYDMRSVYTLTIHSVGDDPVDFGDKILLFNRFLSEIKTNDLYK